MVESGPVAAVAVESERRWVGARIGKP